VNQQLLDELMALKLRDTDTRSRLLKAGKLYGDYASEMQQVHRENANQLDRLIAKHGWPGIALVGLEGCRVAWFIAQHSICTPALQRKFLTLLATASENGDAPKTQTALLTDRIRFNENKPQVYGTVLDWNEQGELACEVEDPGNLDVRRKQVGLEPFQQALEKHRREVESEGGKPPADFSQYQQKGREWARSVGWQ
jgi:hypothetical protein